MAARLLGGKARVVEAATGRIARNKAGTALDGGGHASVKKARKQAGAVNRSVMTRGGRKT